MDAEQRQKDRHDGLQSIHDNPVLHSRSNPIRFISSLQEQFFDLFMIRSKLLQYDF